MGASVLSVSSRALLDACACLGLDTAQILEAARLDPVTLQDPDARLPIEQVDALWKKAYELSNDPNLALHAIEVLPFGAYRVIDFLASSAPTIGAALAKVSDYFPLINAVVRLPYAVGDRHVTFAVEAPSRPSAILRFRQLADTTTLGRGNVDIGVEYASTPIDDAKGAWNNTMSHPAADHYLGGSIAFPRIVARFGVSDRVDVGAWGGLNPFSNYGAVGVDAKIALLRQGQGRPVSVSIRPSITSLVGPSEIWVGNTSVDLSVSRAFGSISPYAGVAASSSAAVERSADVHFDPATAGDALAYAGISYRWRTLMLSADVEKGDLVSYAFRVGKRF